MSIESFGSSSGDYDPDIIIEDDETVQNLIDPDTEDTIVTPEGQGNLEFVPKPSGSFERVPLEVLFRSDVHHSIAVIPKAQSSHSYKPDRSQRFPITDPDMLNELYERGIISAQTLQDGRVSWSEAVAAITLRSNRDRGLLDSGSSQRGLKIIIEEVEKYLTELEQRAVPAPRPTIPKHLKKEVLKFCSCRIIHSPFKGIIL